MGLVFQALPFQLSSRWMRSMEDGFFSGAASDPAVLTSVEFLHSEKKIVGGLRERPFGSVLRPLSSGHSLA